mgnify:CR=1 FL=1
MGRFKLIFFVFIFYFPIFAFTQFLALDTSINATLQWLDNIEKQGYSVVWDGKIKLSNEELNISKEQLQKWNAGQKNEVINQILTPYWDCLLYTSDAADDLLCVDLGGRRIIKKKKQHYKI